MYLWQFELVIAALELKPTYLNDIGRKEPRVINELICVHQNQFEVLDQLLGWANFWIL